MITGSVIIAQVALYLIHEATDTAGDHADCDEEGDAGGDDGEREDHRGMIG